MDTPSAPHKPEVLRFAAVVYEHGGQTLAKLPRAVSDKIRGMEKLEGMIGAKQPFRASVEPDGDDYLLHINQAMLRGADVRIDDTAEFAVLGPEPDPTPPSDLQREFEQSPEATATWNELTTLGKHDWIRWIEDAKKPETRAKRIARTVEQLSEGKRRACCVDVNGFMKCRIREDDERHRDA